jgi:hypothetical protein
MPDIRVHASKEWVYKQSRFFPNVPQIPFRMMCLAPSGGGKTTAIVDICVRLYAGCFSNIWVFSPTCIVDTSWDAVRTYVEHTLKRDPSKHFFEDFNEGVLQGILDRSLKITELARQRGIQPQPSALIVLDDIADDVRITRRSKAVQTLAIRSRHAGLSVVFGLQKLRAVPQLIRINMSDVLVWRLKNLKEKEAIAEEYSAVFGKDATEALIDYATSKPYAFLWINTRAKTPEQTFWQNFETMLRPRPK